MKKKLRRILILFCIFILGVAGFSCLMNSQNTDNKTDTAIESESGNEDFQLQEVSDESVCELLKGHILFLKIIRNRMDIQSQLKIKNF